MSEKKQKKEKKVKDEEIISDSNTTIKSTDSKVVKTEEEIKKEQSKKWYEKIKVPKPLTIIIGVLLFCIFLTWVIPHDAFFQVTDSSGQYLHQHEVITGSGIFVKDGQFWFDSGPFGLNFLGQFWYMPGNGDASRYGLFDTISVIFAGFLGAGGVILFVFCIGAFIEIMMVSGTLEKGVSSLQNKMKGKEIILIPILFLIFSIGGTTYGMQEETIGFFPIIIPFLILTGFDSMTGFLVIVMGTTTGIAASTVNPFSVTVFADSMSTVGGSLNGFTSSSGLVSRFVIWILFTAIGAAVLTVYAERVRKNKDHSFVKEQHDEDIKWARDKYGEIDETVEYEKMTRKQTIALWVFGLTFALMILGMMPYSDWFGWDEAPKWFAVISSLFFGSALLGTWFYLQLSALFIIAAIILGLIFRMSSKEIMSNMYRGAKFMINVAIIIGVARSIAYVLEFSGLSDAMVLFLINDLGFDKLSPIAFTTLLFPVFLILGGFITSTSGLASATGGIIGSTINGMASSPEVAIAMATGAMLSYTLATGIMNMWAPTNGLLLAQADAAHLDYPKIFKPMFMYAVLITLLSLIVIPLSTLIALP